MILGAHAHGGLGDVLSARGPDGAAVVVQVLRPDLAEDVRFSRLLLTEANAARPARIEGVAPFQEAGREGRVLWMAAPMVDGPSLTELRSARWQPEWAFHVGAEVAARCARAHAMPWFPGAPAPLVHGSLAPGAVHLDGEGQVVLTGLGSGRARWLVPPTASRAPYIAPERFAGGALSPRTDVYGVGVLVLDLWALAQGVDLRRDDRTILQVFETAGLRLPEPARFVLQMVLTEVDDRPRDLEAIAARLRSLAGPPEASREELGLLSSGRRSASAPRPGGAWTLDVGALLPRAEAEEGPRLPSPVGRYRLLARIVEAGARTVYRAHDPNLDRAVVLHRLEPTSAGEAELDAERAARAFKEEARRAARLDHPGLPDLLDAGRHGPALFAVYRHVPGRTLAETLEVEGPLSPTAVGRLGADWADALAALHRAGLLHRGLRPGALLVGEDGRGRLDDLSRCRPVDGPEEPRATAEALAPECAGGASATERADQFALGACLYEALLGAPPLLGRDAAERRPALLEAAFRGPDAMDRRLPPWLDRALRRCLDPDPEARYPDLEALARALEAGGWGRVDAADPKLSSLADPELLRAYLAQAAPERAGPIRDARAAARRLDGQGALEAVVAVSAALAGRARPGPTVPDWAQASTEAVSTLLRSATAPPSGPVGRAPALAWAALRFSTLARPPHGEGALAPARAWEKVQDEASGLGVERAVLRSLGEQLGPRIAEGGPAVPIGDRVLILGGESGWADLVTDEGYRVVQVDSRDAAWAELTGGDYFGVVLSLDGAGEDGRRLLRSSLEHPPTRHLRFVLVGGELQPEDHGPRTWAVPISTPEAVRAVVRGWRD